MVVLLQRELLRCKQEVRNLRGVKVSLNTQLTNIQTLTGGYHEILGKKANSFIE
jgi:hypothetical protein